MACHGPGDDGLMLQWLSAEADVKISRFLSSISFDPGSRRKFLLLPSSQGKTGDWCLFGIWQEHDSRSLWFA
ncbi:hypothetical protein DM806_18235 [Sphingobium lactosutens]|nr:hypothetical protein [Sphingobium lactosutens]